MSVPARYMKYRFSIYAVLTGLEQRLDHLTEALAESSQWAWTAEQSKGEDALAHVLSALTALDFEDDVQDATQALEAVVSVSSECLELVDGVNQAKRMLKQAFLEITNERVLIDGERKPLAQAILRDMGRARLDRQRAYRHFFMLEELPSHIGFSRSHIRTVARKNQMQVFAWLSKMTQENTESYRNTIAALDPDLPLALVKGRYQSQRANVCVDGNWTMVPAHLPLFIPPCDYSRVNIKPAARKKGEGEEARVRSRSDERLEPNPLFTIGATSVYRYDAAYRDSSTVSTT